MDDVVRIVAYYLEQLRKDEGDDPEMSLIEADHAVVPLLEAEFSVERDPQVRRKLIHIIWQHRLPTSVSILEEAIADSDPAVWKEALDGLVTLGSREAREVLKNTLNRSVHHPHRPADFSSWVEEAIQQIDDYA